MRKVLRYLEWQFEVGNLSILKVLTNKENQELKVGSWPWQGRKCGGNPKALLNGKYLRINGKKKPE